MSDGRYSTISSLVRNPQANEETEEGLTQINTAQPVFRCKGWLRDFQCLLGMVCSGTLDFFFRA